MEGRYTKTGETSCIQQHTAHVSIMTKTHSNIFMINLEFPETVRQRQSKSDKRSDNFFSNWNQSV